jgi:hypothetical protein
MNGLKSDTLACEMRTKVTHGTHGRFWTSLAIASATVLQSLLPRLLRQMEAIVFAQTELKRQNQCEKL